MIVLQILAFCVGFLIVAATVQSAVVTFILPRGASHFITIDGEVLHADLCGSYTHRFTRSADGWAISGCKLDVAGYPAGIEAFERAFAVARERYTKGETG